MNTKPDDDQPRSMRDPAVRDCRRAMLSRPHMIRLKTFAENLRRPGLEVPDFDPADGGVKAQALFLFEKPGPMTVTGGRGKRTGSGFISRNNDDPTAEAVFNFMHEAAIPRELTILWNVIPGWNGTRAVTAFELQDGVSSLNELICLLPELKAVMLVGQKAARAKLYCKINELALFTCDHPSPLVRARWPERWNAITSEWRKVASVIV